MTKPRGPVEAVAFAIAWQRNVDPREYTEEDWAEAERFVHLVRALQEWDAAAKAPIGSEPEL